VNKVRAEDGPQRNAASVRTAELEPQSVPSFAGVHGKVTEFERSRRLFAILQIGPYPKRFLRETGEGPCERICHHQLRWKGSKWRRDPD